MSSNSLHIQHCAKSAESGDCADSSTDVAGSSMTTGSPEIPQHQSVPRRRRDTDHELSSTSSILDGSWTKQYVLSFERQPPKCAMSSFDPQTSSRPKPEVEREEIGHSSFKTWLARAKSKRRLGEYERIARNQSSQNGADDIKARHDRSQYLPCHYFDYIGGTSTGGLISIMLGRLRMSVDDTIEEYEDLAGYIFGHPRLFSIRGPILFPRDKYDARRVVDVIEHVVSKHLCGKTPLLIQNPFASHERMCKTIVVAYGSRSNEEGNANAADPPYLFRSYDHHPHISDASNKYSWAERNPGYAHRIPIWQVARATSAAPTYFNPITIEDQKFLDGAFGTNNPTREVFDEVCQMNGNQKSSVGLLVSIGTGMSTTSKFAESRFKTYYTYFKAAQKLAVNAEKVHQDISRDFNTSDENDQIYHRFNVPLNLPQTPTAECSSSKDHQIIGNTTRRRIKPLGSMALDEWKPKSRIFRRKCNTTIRDIKEATEAYLADPKVQADLEAVASTLVRVRRERCENEYWEILEKPKDEGYQEGPEITSDSCP
ncbi:hypothetical protein BP6252_13090 [Coleophoma cylindrospora]|uniref:PNPLA domain-containing protein n=1 Tax=Coleophoma cylindrospora TaxID=1849047 RepID=A0A3D8QAV3_9HELO|nr:hypothetical protein BP6252_13090 [Coleophoma cylindrospora]